MPFVSPEFVLFFSIVFPAFFLVPPRYKSHFLLAVSGIFYAYAGIAALVLLSYSVWVDFWLAQHLQKTEDAKWRLRWLWLGVVHNLFWLILLKYPTFFLGLGSLPSNVVILSEIHPVGLSFYTFTKIAYLVDVYWRVLPAVTNPVTFGTFVAFFPNITSGPIERAAHLLPQLQQPLGFDYDRVVSGCRLLLWGGFKKIVIADTLARYVNAVYDTPQAYSGAILACATFFLAFQIYADFSGYTDMARGIARILGIQLFENFRQPYFAQSVTEFWRGWHISLSNWIRELMFVPLSRLLMRRNQRLSPRISGVTAQVIVMALVGLWHGAALTFVVWGLLHGIYLSVEAWFRRPPNKKAEPAWRPLWRMLRTFSFVSLAWIFFRANSLEDAVYILTHLPILTTDNPAGISLFGRIPFLLNFVLIALLMYTDWLERKQPLPDRLAQQALPMRWLVYYGLTCSILGVIILNTTPPPLFIYFAF